jgi:hypothetical protein
MSVGVHFFALETADRKCSAFRNLGGFSAGGWIAKADILSADLPHVAFQSSVLHIITSNFIGDPGRMNTLPHGVEVCYRPDMIVA